MEVQELLARQHRIDTGIGETVLGNGLSLMDSVSQLNRSWRKMLIE